MAKATGTLRARNATAGAWRDSIVFARALVPAIDQVFEQVAHLLVPDAAPAVDWSKPETWEFFPLDDEAFPAVSLARQAGERGATAPAVYNAANEEAVAAFLAGRLRYLDIAEVVEDALAAGDWSAARDLDELVECTIFTTEGGASAAETLLDRGATAGISSERADEPHCSQGFHGAGLCLGATPLGSARCLPSGLT